MPKTLYYSLLVLCGGFAVLEYIQGTPMNATMWLIALATVVLIQSIAEQKHKKPAKPALKSVLEPETQAALKAGKTMDKAPKGVRLRESETCLWYDNAAQDYYDGKSGTMILTDQRLIFLSDGFTFSHPNSTVNIKETKSGIELDVQGKKMRFITASKPLMIEIWKRYNEQDQS